MKQVLKACFSHEKGHWISLMKEDKWEQMYHSERPWRSLYFMIGADPLWHFGMFILLCIKNLPVVLPPVMLSLVVATLQAGEADAFNDILIYFGIYALLWLQNIPSHVLWVKFMSVKLRRMEWKLRSRLSERIQQLSIHYFTEKETGNLQAKILRDVENIQQICEMLLHNCMHAVFTLLVALGAVMMKAPPLSVIVLILIPICALMVAQFKRQMRDRNSAYRERLEGMNSRVNEMVTMMPITRSHGLEEVELNRVHERLGEVKTHGQRLDTMNALFSACSTCSVYVTLGFALVISSFICIQGTIAPADVILYQGLMWQVTFSLMGILQMYPQIAKGIEGVSSLGEVLECPTIEANADKPSIEHVRGRVHFDNVNFAYPNKDESAVHNMSFSVQQGECIAIVGESGSGKSTLMNLLIGFWPPNEGAIYVDGKNLTEHDLRTYRQHIAVVPQHTTLFSGTLYENITHGIENIDTQKVEDAINAANLRSIIDKLDNGVHTMVGANGLQLSGGQRQRVAIARAIIRDPSILILDEATSALDVKSEKLVQEAINRLIVGRTTFIIAHRLSTIRDADRILVLSDGHLIECGTPQELSRPHTYFSKLKELQI